MGYSIPTSDIVAICLMAADYDPGTSIGEVIRRVERHQRIHDCYLGASESDFRGAFRRFGIDELGLSLNDLAIYSVDELLDLIPLREWIIRILRYNDLYCNDEGEFWDREEEFPAGSEYNYAVRNRPMREFFAVAKHYTRDFVIAFFEGRPHWREVYSEHFR